MTAFASLSMGLDLSRRSEAALVAQDVLETFPGTRNVTLDAATGASTFEIIFPGNLSALVGRLRANGIPVGDSARLSLPVRSLVPNATDVDDARMAHMLDEGPEIWDVQFERGHYVSDASVQDDNVRATIVPSTNSMHQLYDGLVRLGIVAAGQATA